MTVGKNISECTTVMNIFKHFERETSQIQYSLSRDILAAQFDPAFVRLFVYFFPHDISNTDAARLTKLDTEMFHHESWKPTYFWAHKIKVTRHTKSLLV